MPHSLRPTLWPRLLHTEAKQARLGLSYREVAPPPSSPQVVAATAVANSNQSHRQIEKDLLRTLPTNICFARPEAAGIPR